MHIIFPSYIRIISCFLEGSHFVSFLPKLNIHSNNEFAGFHRFLTRKPVAVGNHRKSKKLLQLV